MKIEFRNDEYIKATGKTPKGTGCWAFADRPYPAPEDVKIFYGTLAQAKAQAKYYYTMVAKQIGETWIIIYILP